MKRCIIYKLSDQYIKFFKFIASFDHYSRFNSALVYKQNDAVTFYGGAAFWDKYFNRTIKEDAKQYIILVPKGPVMVVYDIFETEGEQTTDEILEEGLGRKPFKTDGKINDQLFDHAYNVAESMGIKLKDKPLSYFDSGYIATLLNGHLEICFKEGQSIEEKFSVLMHELAHLFLGHLEYCELVQAQKDDHISILRRNKIKESTKELEAETTCYLITTKLGLIKNSEEYLANFIKSPDDLAEFSYETVIKTANLIEKHFIAENNSKKWSLKVFKKENLTNNYYRTKRL